MTAADTPEVAAAREALEAHGASEVPWPLPHDWESQPDCEVAVCRCCGVVSDGDQVATEDNCVVRVVANLGLSIGGRIRDRGHLRAVLAAHDALAARLAEAEATLLNEHGGGSPPSEGWAWKPTPAGLRWRGEEEKWCEHGWCGPFAHVVRVGSTWCWEANDVSPGRVRRYASAPTARAAMRAADEAARRKA